MLTWNVRHGKIAFPVDYPTHYSTGDPVAAVKAAVDKPIMRMMYGAMFKYNLRDRFMAYMGINGWNTDFDLKRIAELASMQF
jgi:hypothetical protein